MNFIALYPTGMTSETTLSRIYAITYEVKPTIWDFLENGQQPCFHDFTGSMSLILERSVGWVNVDVGLFETMKTVKDKHRGDYGSLDLCCCWPFGRPSLALARIYHRMSVWDLPELVLTPRLMKSICRQTLQQSKKVSDQFSLSDQIIMCYLKIKYRMKRFGLDHRMISGSCLLKDLLLCQLLTGQIILERRHKRIVQEACLKRCVKVLRKGEQEAREMEKEKERMLLGLPLRPELFWTDERFLVNWLSTKWTKDWPTLEESFRVN
ncbi:nonstructural protein [Silverwater virus]|uniref:Nonstructural protein n=1 Tax=Silverwater virus TaxID=1564099 RepID=A0A097SRW0_9VIRU|nr:nonstructural protein [Silverwater virus]AIU95031.1 nonstructural protein [Silverwater virus]